MAGRGPVCLSAPAGGEGAGAGLEVLRGRKQTPPPRLLSLHQATRRATGPSGLRKGGGTWQVLCQPGSPNMVSVIKIITADIYGGLAMCQALCQEFLTLSFMAPSQGEYCAIFVPT